MTSHRIGTREEWFAARAGLLEREKQLTRMGDELARQRRKLPWLPVEKEYTLQTADGAKTLAELFDGRSQLVIYHFMFGPGYTAGCPACASSYDSDFNFDFGVSAGEWMTHGSAAPRLQANELTLLKLLEDQPAVRESLPPVAAQNARATGTDLEGYFSQGHGFSTFAREGGTLYHCYSSYARGTEFLMGYYAILDRAPKGRDEGDQPMGWVRRHDEYDSQ